MTSSTNGNKCIIIGNGGIGKTSYILRLLGHKFEKKYNPTSGVIFNSIQINDNVFIIYDFSGQEMFNDNIIESYSDSNGAIVMFDLTSKLSFKSIKNYIENIYKFCGNIPIVIVGNKSDIIDRVIITNEVIDDFICKMKIFIEQKYNYQNLNINYEQISVKNNDNLEQPFLYLTF